LCGAMKIPRAGIGNLCVARGGGESVGWDGKRVCDVR